MRKELEDIKSVGDLIAIYLSEVFNEKSYNFETIEPYLELGLCKRILNERFGFENLDTTDFNRWGVKTIKSTDSETGYIDVRTFNVEDMRKFLNEKYKQWK